MNEPSLLDFIKAKLMPWKYSISEEFIQKDSDLIEEISVIELDTESREIKRTNLLLGWSHLRLLFALVSAVFGQLFLEPPDRNVSIAIIFFVISLALVVWAAFSSESIYFYQNNNQSTSLKIDLSSKNLSMLGVSMLFLVLAFFSFRPNNSNEIYFNFLNISFWVLSLIFFLIALVDFQDFSKKFSEWKTIYLNKEIMIKVTPWVAIIVFSTILIFYFRFFRLNGILGEMFSDHAEKLLDVHDVLSGKYPVFFVRNTGREFFQFYWTALVAIIFKTGISFMSLKIGTALAGFLTLPYIYLLGKELRNKWVGLFAFLFAGIAYWPNVISRVGLRFPFYPLFVAPTLFYLIRGIRQKRRNDFIYAGIALGLGLHGYSSTRFLPFVVVAALIIYLLHRQSKGLRNQVLNAFIPLVIASFILFLPLFKFTLVNPDVVSYRMMTRLTSSEREITQPPLEVFFENLWKAETMFFFNNGGTWVHSIPNRPALDMISAGLYLVGTMIVIIQYLKFRNWEDIFLVIAVPLLMMPSILSLAFPDENPSLNRTGGAIIPVFIIIAIGFERVFCSLWRVANKWKSKLTVITLGGLFFLFAAMINYDLVFNQFNKQFMAGAWNTSQMGAIIKGFAESTGNLEQAYVVPSPHWVDTRLVGINVGYPTKDYALWPDQFEILTLEQGEKLVILKPDNIEAMDKLKSMFPNGILYNYDSGFDGKDFYIYHIPPTIIQDLNILNP
jgi:hypothetical protein